MHQAPNRRTLTIVFATLLLILACAVQPVTALPPEVEADKLLVSVAEKMNNKDFSGAGEDLDKIKSLGVTLPVEFYLQNGRYLIAMRNATDAKKSLETYLEKAGKEGRYYQGALKLYGYAEANEKRWGRFKENDDGTVNDNQTGLMWAPSDNGTNISWLEARQYCVNYSGGGYKDWRLPTQNELAELYDKEEKKSDETHLTPLIKLSYCSLWAAETRGSHAAAFGFCGQGGGGWHEKQYGTSEDGNSTRIYALPVRGGK